MTDYPQKTINRIQRWLVKPNNETPMGEYLESLPTDSPFMTPEQIAVATAIMRYEFRSDSELFPESERDLETALTDMLEILDVIRLEQEALLFKWYAWQRLANWNLRLQMATFSLKRSADEFDQHLMDGLPPIDEPDSDDPNGNDPKNG